MDNNSKEILRSVQSKVSHAHNEFKRRMDSFGDEQGEAFRSYVAQDAESRQSDDLVVVDCPVCESQATVAGENTVEHEVSYGSEPDEWIQFNAHYFFCGACGLELDGDEEIRLANMETNWVNDRIDYVRFMRDAYGDY